MFTDGRYFLQAGEQMDECVLSTHSTSGGFSEHFQKLEIDEAGSFRNWKLMKQGAASTNIYQFVLVSLIAPYCFQVCLHGKTISPRQELFESTRQSLKGQNSISPLRRGWELTQH